MTTTERGFDRIDFTDRYGKECSLQKSSLAFEDAVWLGCTEGTHHPDYPPPNHCLARMHLTVEMVRELLPHLQAFVETGEIALTRSPAAPSEAKKET